MTIGAIFLTVVLGLIVNECCELAPWCARKLVRWSAFLRYTDPARADMRAEELTAVIDDRPGKLFKLITALGFVGAASLASARRFVVRRLARDKDVQEADSGGSAVFEPMGHADVLARVYSYLDGDLSEPECAAIRHHLQVEECGSCLREFGLLAAVRRLLEEHSGSDPVPRGLWKRVGKRVRLRITDEGFQY